MQHLQLTVWWPGHLSYWIPSNTVHSWCKASKVCLTNWMSPSCVQHLQSRHHLRSKFCHPTQAQAENLPGCTFLRPIRPILVKLFHNWNCWDHIAPILVALHEGKSQGPRCSSAKGIQLLITQLLPSSVWTCWNPGHWKSRLWPELIMHICIDIMCIYIQHMCIYKHQCKHIICV